MSGVQWPINHPHIYPLILLVFSLMSLIDLQLKSQYDGTEVPYKYLHGRGTVTMAEMGVVCHNPAKLSLALLVLNTVPPIGIS